MSSVTTGNANLKNYPKRQQLRRQNLVQNLQTVHMVDMSVWCFVLVFAHLLARAFAAIR